MTGLRVRDALPHLRGPAVAAAIPAVCWAAHATILRRQIERARRDPLTGLVTRQAWTRRATHLIRDPRAAVLLVDLDRFKQINDTYGHPAGDQVLTETANRLTSWCGRNGVAGRIGGDEFVAVITVLDIEAEIGRLRQAMAAPVLGLDVHLVASASIGYTAVAEDARADLPELLRKADAAMYAAKSRSQGIDQAQIPVNGRRPGRSGTHRTAVAA